MVTDVARGQMSEGGMFGRGAEVGGRDAGDYEWVSGECRRRRGNNPGGAAGEQFIRRHH